MSGHLPTGHQPEGHLPLGHLPSIAAGAAVVVRGSSRSLVLTRNQGSLDIPGQPVVVSGSSRSLLLTRNQGSIAVGQAGGAGYLATPWYFQWPDNRARFATRRST